MENALTSNSDLVGAIKAGAASRENAVQRIRDHYIYFIRIFSGKSKYRSLSSAEVMHAFARTIHTFTEMAGHGRFDPASRVKNTLYDIMQGHCDDLVREKNGEKPALPAGSGENETDFDLYEFLAYREDLDLGLKCMQALGPACYSLLVDFEKGYTLDELAVKLSLTDAEHAQKRRQGCKRMLRKVFAKISDQ